jgi:hypothetical protein
MDLPAIEWAVSSWYLDFYQKNPRLSFYLKTQSLLLWGVMTYDLLFQNSKLSMK